MSQYKIIGGDQREYGPVSDEQLRQWIAEGRANAQTLIQSEGSEDWKPLGLFPEFSDALAAKDATIPSLPPPQPRAPFSDTAFEEYCARAARLDLGSCFQRSWDLLQRNFLLLSGASILILIITVGLEFIPMAGPIAGAVLGLVFWGGLDWLFLKAVRGGRAEFSDAFAGFQIRFVQLMLAGIVTSVLILIGLMLCILPGIFLMVIWIPFTPLLIMDKGLDFWPAMELSRRVVMNNFWIIFALFLLVVVAMVAGSLLLLVGLIITLPLAVGAGVYAYEDIFHGTPAGVPSSS